MEWNVNLDSKSSITCWLPFRSWPPGCWLLLESSVVGDLAGGAGGGFSFPPLVPGPRRFFCRMAWEPGAPGGVGKAFCVWKLGDLGGSGGGVSQPPLLFEPGKGGAGTAALGEQEA